MTENFPFFLHFLVFSSIYPFQAEFRGIIKTTFCDNGLWNLDVRKSDYHTLMQGSAQMRSNKNRFVQTEF